MHPLLLPGTHVLRRPDGVFQLGLAPSEAVRLEHEDAGGRLAPVAGSPGLAESPALTARLVKQHAAAADDTQLRNALAPDRPENRWQRHTMASLFRDAPALMAARVGERGTKRIRVRGFGHPLDESLRADLLDLLRRASLTAQGPKPSGPPPGTSCPPSRSTCSSAWASPAGPWSIRSCGRRCPTSSSASARAPPWWAPSCCPG